VSLLRTKQSSFQAGSLHLRKTGGTNQVCPRPKQIRKKLVSLHRGKALNIFEMSGVISLAGFAVFDIGYLMVFVLGKVNDLERKQKDSVVTYAENMP